MSAASPEATGNDSRGGRRLSGGDGVRRLTLALRGLLVLAGVAGVVLEMLATRAAIIKINIITTGDTASGIDTSLSGADRHGPALIVIGVFAAVMLAAALRGARPAAFAVAAAGILTLGIAVLADARHIDDTGIVGQLYAGATAGAGTGFYYETLGGALLLMAGGGLLVLGGGGGRPQPSQRPLAAAPAPSRPAGDDWFSEQR